MRLQEKPVSVLPPMFPSNRRRYVRVPPKHAYECVIYTLKERFNLEDSEIRQLDDLSLETDLGGKIGARVSVHVIQEGDISVINLSFRYRKMAFFASSLLAAAIILCLLFNMPILMLSVAILIPMAYHVNFEVVRLLDALNEFLPLIEEKYTRQTLLKDRERWRKYQKDVQSLYEKLCRKHLETWGDTNVLKYKIEEYQAMGLTYEEAVIKIAEEEGIIVKNNED